MQSNEELRKNTRLAESFFFQERKIFVFQPKEAIFDFCAADVFHTLELAKEPEGYRKIYNALAVKYISPNCFFENEKGDLQEIKMLNFDGVKHLAGRVSAPVGKEFVAWAEQDLPVLAVQARSQNESQSVDFQSFNFENDNNTLRTFCDNQGNIWFIAKDICKILDLENVSKACEKLHYSEKTTITISDSASNQKHPSLIVSESGFYALVFKSQKSNAERFRIWVTSEVLPTLRKTGRYEIAPKQQPKIVANVGFTPEQTDFLQTILQSQQNMEAELAQIKALLPALMPKLVKSVPCYVYLGQHQDNFQCKIGQSEVPKERIFVLEGGGSEIKLLALLKVPSVELALYWESVFHKWFEKESKGREWFRLNERQIAYLMKMMRILNEYYEIY